MKEHEQAVAAIAAARLANAQTYAAEELAAAESALARYDNFVAQRDFRQALNTALDARDRAYDAASTASARQRTLRSDAEALLRTLDAAAAAADRLIKAPHPRSAVRQVAKLRQTRKTTTAVMQEARTLLDAGELNQAIKTLTAASAALKRDIDALDATSKKPKKS